MINLLSLIYAKYSLISQRRIFAGTSMHLFAPPTNPPIVCFVCFTLFYQSSLWLLHFNKLLLLWTSTDPSTDFRRKILYKFWKN